MPWFGEKFKGIFPHHKKSNTSQTKTKISMNPDCTTAHLSLLSEPIGPIDESDLVSLDPQGFDRPALRRSIFDEEPEASDTNRIVWNDWDVPIGRGRAVREFVGNERYRDLIEQYRPTYLRVKKRKEKRDVSVSIYNIIRSNGGRFLAPSGLRGESWYEISREKALAKIGQALRIGVRPPQQTFPSSWTYPVESNNKNRRHSDPAPPRPLFVNMPLSTTIDFRSTSLEFADNISNLSFTSEDQLRNSPHASRDLDATNSQEWRSPSPFDPNTFI